MCERKQADIADAVWQNLGVCQEKGPQLRNGLCRMLISHRPSQVEDRIPQVREIENH